MLALYHEIDHANQDAAWRRSLRTAEEVIEYEKFCENKSDKPKKTLLSDEVATHAKMCEVADLILGGKLRSGELTVDEAMQALHAEEKQRKLVESILLIAGSYFRGGLPSLLSVLAFEYKARGEELFIRNPQTKELIKYGGG
jgi:hypothetical protein